jgi:hypothetical protein
MEELGQDADLLTRSDPWLEQERVRLSEELEKVATHLRAVHVAQKIKRQLQQKNLVAVQQLLRDADGEVKNIIVRIMNLPDALSMLSTSDTLDELNVAAQLHGWKEDGYDLVASAALR